MELKSLPISHCCIHSLSRIDTGNFPEGYCFYSEGDYDDGTVLIGSSTEAIQACPEDPECTEDCIAAGDEDGDADWIWCENLFNANEGNYDEGNAACFSDCESSFIEDALHWYCPDFHDLYRNTSGDGPLSSRNLRRMRKRPENRFRKQVKRDKRNKDGVPLRGINPQRDRAWNPLDPGES